MKKSSQNFCKKGIHVLSTWILVLFANLATAQNFTISGKVNAGTGEALEGVTVQLKKGKQATITDANGNYSISLPGSKAVLVFSYVGFITKEQTVAPGSPVNITLQRDENAIQDVVVIGYGSVKKSDLTGSVASIKAKDFTQGANISVEQSLAGRVAGVQISQKSGEPGSAMNIKIRGISSITGGNDPLYVIDGMPVNNNSPVSASGSQFPNNPNPRNPLNALNPSDIESIEILKDASATAIYGSRGSNGVVMITTKKGVKDRLSVGYSGYYGIQNVTRKLDLLTGDEYKLALNGIIDAGGGVPSEKVTHDVVNTDWQDFMFRQASVQSHDLSITGGKDNTRFYASLGYFNQEGVLVNSASKRYNARFNLETSVSKKYAFGISLGTSYIRDNYSSVGLGINENGSGLYASIYYDPSYAALDADGNNYRSPFMGSMDHPLALRDDQFANSDNFRTFGNIYGEYFFIPSLSLKLRVGGDVNNTRRNTWVGPATIIGLPVGGIATINTGTTTYYMGEATLNYKNDFGKDHSVTGLLGITSDNYGSYSFNGNGRGYALPDLTYDAIGSGDQTQNQISSGRASSKIISYLARATYSFKNRYLLTGSIRADGSSRFGPNNRYAYFPSVALAWKVTEEEWFKNQKLFDEIKLRTSYGSVGNQNIANYLYISSFSTGSGAGNDAVFGNTIYNTISPSRPANPDLKWEGSLQFDAGIDFSMLNRRLSGTIDYFNRKAIDLLLALPQPLSTGFATRTQNIGDMRNEGIEITLNGTVIKGKNFNWTLSGNFSKIKNEVLNLGPIPEIIRGGAGNLGNYEIVRPGESIGSYFGYRVIGVWQTSDDFSKAPTGVKPGDWKFYDKDTNRIINANDRVILGTALPDFTYGFSSNLSFKGLSFALFFDGQKGAYNISNTLVDSYYPVSFRRNKLATPYVERWTASNPSNQYPSFVNPQFSASGSQGNQQINSVTVQDASYFRLQAATLSYSFNLGKTKFIKSIQVNVTGQNLFLVTNYIGYDPALNATGSDIIKIDYSSYPMSRNWLFGLSAQF